MAKTKSSKPSEPSPRPLLRVPREQARQQLQAQIDKGRGFLAREIRGPAELHDAREEYYRWDDYNFELLRSLFTTEEYARNYKHGVRHGVRIFGRRPFQEELNEFHDDLKDYINKIQSIQDRLSVIPEDPGLSHSITVSEQSQMQPFNEVFVVHGHDELAKQTVARFIEKLDLKAIILHEQLNQGKTIIEKFESFSGVGFAVILLTPDDVGTTKAAHTQGKGPNDRARQNVIFEHGFFLGKLGRGHVCALVKGDVEIPSDLHGVVYIPLDEPGAWQYRLAREMKASGLPVDLNKLG
jgi:predicted nucleotide-binding protein